MFGVAYFSESVFSGELVTTPPTLPSIPAGSGAAYSIYAEAYYAEAFFSGALAPVPALGVLVSPGTQFTPGVKIV